MRIAEWSGSTVQLMNPLLLVLLSVVEFRRSWAWVGWGRSPTGGRMNRLLDARLNFRRMHCKVDTHCFLRPMRSPRVPGIKLVLECLCGNGRPRICAPFLRYGLGRAGFRLLLTLTCL